MGKQGPCYHCGVTSTPLWRNGPPQKPVLCNACGSRWRTKGTLANYTPLHAREEGDDYEDQRVSRVKSMPLNMIKEVKSLKRKLNNDSVVYGGLSPDYNLGFRKALNEVTNNRSSSGSTVSNSESCAQFSGTDASDLTGPVQPVVWDTMVPSKKRTCVGRPEPSSVEKLTKDLCTILHEQQSYFSASSEEDLLFESETPMVSVEIGHGTILMRHPSYIAREEESEASSLSIDNKQCAVNNAYLYPGAILMHNDSSGMNFSSQGVEKVRKTTGQGMQQEQLRRENSQLEREQILGGHDSPLRLIDLNDVVNYEEFLKNLTDAEQQQLLKFLPVVDAVKLPDSLKFMFNSSQFKENLTYFQQLLAEGVFDISLSGTKPEDCKTLKRHALSNLSKSKWVEHYYFLKIQRCKTRSGKSVTLGSNGTVSSYVAHVKRMCENQNQNSPELKTIMRSPKRVVAKAGYEGKEVVEDGSHYSPKSLFALPPEASSLFLDSSNFVEESSDQDLLLEVPSNSYFPEAELLPPTFSFGAQASTSNSSVYSHLN
ncbi:PREDICTED: GATA transcription factor 26-like isoform X1 [Lupinus angustifolius]|uniref:GATA transcription factor 26-like isoform X1 n=1 Tax=Lupinus angustifolius TaxID=3871 RepID=UPI00092EDB10|nr:PREDICTED: GATA transcription factor 26-like isoform X1 [Lupinus angustifolius]